MVEILIPEVKKVALINLKVDGKNPNKMSKEQRDALKKNIQRYGFLIPIITNKDYLIADGQHRFEIARELDMIEVPVIKLDVPEVDRRMIRQIMNKLRGEHDDTLDMEEFRFLFDNNMSEDFKRLSLIDIGALNMQFNELDDNTEDDIDDMLHNIRYKIQNGELWKLGNSYLMCGDATNKNDVIKLMQNKKADLMVTDPPYGVEYNPQWRNETNLKNGIKRPTRAVGIVNNDNKIDWSDAYNLFEGNVMYVWHAGKYTSEVENSIKKCGFNIISQIIWVKPHFVLSRGDYHWKHEPCWYAVRNNFQHNWMGARDQTTVWDILGMNCFGKSQNEEDYQTGHGTQKPIDCMATPIKNNSKKGDIIYDPFGGSGTTLIACEQLNRDCYMMEIDPSYCSVIIQRWEKLTGKRAEKINE